MEVLLEALQHIQNIELYNNIRNRLLISNYDLCINIPVVLSYGMKIEKIHQMCFLREMNVDVDVIPKSFLRLITKNIEKFILL